LHPRLAAALPLLLGVFSVMALVVRGPETYARGETRRLAQTLQEHLSKRSEPWLIAGTRASLRVPRVFRHEDSSRHVAWRELSPRELRRVVEGKGGELVLRDVPRELTLARYLEPEARRDYRDELARAEELLWREYALAHVDAKYALFEPASAQSPPIASLSSPWIAPWTPPPEAKLTSGAVCRVATDDPAAWRTLIPTPGTGSRAVCEKTWPSDGRGPASDAANTSADASGLVLRLHADYEVPLVLMVDVIQHFGSRARHQQVSVPPGTSYVPVRIGAGARGLSLVYRVNTRGAREGEVVRVRPAEWRAHRFADGEDELDPDPVGSAS
jgi:hypothetical protein